jgi:hypothetical protein
MVEMLGKTCIDSFNRRHEGDDFVISSIKRAIKNELLNQSFVPHLRRLLRHRIEEQYPGYTCQVGIDDVIVYPIDGAGVASPGAFSLPLRGISYLALFPTFTKEEWASCQRLLNAQPTPVRVEFAAVNQPS